MAVPAAARPALWPEGGRLPPSRIIPGLPGSQNGSEGRKKGSPAPERFSPAELSPRGRRTEERGRRPLGSAARQSLGPEGIWAGGGWQGQALEQDLRVVFQLRAGRQDKAGSS